MSALTAETVRTRRLDLLPLRTEHAGEMAGVLSDPALHTFIGGTPYGPEALRERYRRLAAGSPDPAVLWLNWVIRLREEGCLTGTVQATVTLPGDGDGDGDGGGIGSGGDGRSEAGAVAEVAWVVGTPWQGRGIAAEAARGLVGLLGREPVRPGCPVRAVVAHIHPGHHASAAVAAAAGLTPTTEVHDGEIRWHRTLTG